MISVPVLLDELVNYVYDVKRNSFKPNNKFEFGRVIIV